ARARSTFLLAVLSATGLGFAGTVVAMHSRYLLLYQASPYRALWLVELLAVPLAFWGASWLWKRGRPLGRCSALVLLLLFTTDWNRTPLKPAVVFAALWPVAAVCYRGLGRTPSRPDWLAKSSGAAFLASCGLLLACNVATLAVLLPAQPQFDLDVHPVTTFQAAGGLLY